MNNKYTLLFISAIILISMIAFRILYSGKLYYLFLIWNTFLAAVPYAVSEYATHLKKSKLKTSMLVSICILFLPNALYLISDFTHLAERPPVPFFFDILLLFYAALLGLFLNVLALRNLHNIVLHYFSKKRSNMAIMLIIFLSGFGVYLGRYLRWNSWDIITNPIPLIYDCAHRVLQPHLYTYTWAVSIGYAFVLGFAYLFFINSQSLFQERTKSNND